MTAKRSLLSSRTAASLRLLAGLAAAAALAGCTKGDSPNPPQTPKTMTDLGHFTTTHMELPARPASTTPGIM